MYSFLSISSSVPNLMAHYPMGTISANHADLLQYLLLTSFVSAGQRPFFRSSSQKKTEGNVMINDHARLREGIAYSDSVFLFLLCALR
jgi:hypothetical protein